MPRVAISENDMVNILLQIERKVPIRQLAAQYNVHHTTIYRRLRTWRDEGRLGMQKMKRRKKLSARQIQSLVRLVKNDPYATFDDINATLGFPISTCTVSRYLKANGISHRLSPKKFSLKPIDCEARVEIAIRRAAWSVEKWKNIVFCDESHCDNSGAQRRHVWRPKSSRFNQNYIYKFPNKKLRLNYFSWISAYGPGELLFYRKMNSQLYCETIVPTMINSLREKFGSDNFLIIHDNASFSNSNYTTKFLNDNDYSKFFIPIPPYSPDMNIIENVWGVLKFQAKNHCFLYGQTEGEDFENLLKTEWQRLSNHVEKLYLSLPKRMRTIVSANGSLTRY